MRSVSSSLRAVSHSSVLGAVSRIRVAVHAMTAERQVPHQGPIKEYLGGVY
jgi:hypothetical protein